jgi:hypothetical protein
MDGPGMTLNWQSSNAAEDKPEPEEESAYKADDPGKVTPHGAMTRDEWIAYHVARAPKITRRQWADTILLLRRRPQGRSARP